MSAALSKFIREELLHLDGIRKHTPMRRAMTLFTAESPSDSILFVESGFVKLVRRCKDGKEVLVSIVPPGQIFGVESLFISGPRQFTAEVMQEGTVYEIPRDLFLGFCDTRPEIWRQIAELSVRRERELQHKVAMLSLYDVESRILHHLAILGPIFCASGCNGQEYSIPLSQSELASLIGATRETTSTTLNALARRGLIRLGRRLLVVSSTEAVNAAVNERAPKVQGAATD